MYCHGHSEAAGLELVGLGVAQPGSGHFVGEDASARRQVFTANWWKKKHPVTASSCLVRCDMETVLVLSSGTGSWSMKPE